MIFNLVEGAVSELHHEYGTVVAGSSRTDGLHHA